MVETILKSTVSSFLGSVKKKSYKTDSKMNHFPVHLNQRLTFYQKDLDMLYAAVLAGTFRSIAN